jgi:ferrous iron transport protein B
VAQLLELRIPLIIALNMVDLAERSGVTVRPDVLSIELGVPVIPIVASTGFGVVQLKQALSRGPGPIGNQKFATMPPQIDEAAEAVSAQLSEVPEPLRRAEAIRLLSDPDASAPGTSREIIASTQRELLAAGVDVQSAVVDARYRWIGGIVERTSVTASIGHLSVSDRLDAVLTHRVWGWLAFGGAMAAVFFCIFSVAAYPMEWIENGVSWLGELVGGLLPESDFRSLIVDGVFAGVGGVVVFLPQIMILFFFLGLLEDSGYMARAAFIMDRVMSKAGLQGKCFIPMLSSFACAIPGVMATRSIENRSDRLATILVAPLMSCSARIPVYGLMIAVLIPHAGPWQQAGIMLAMYALGTVAAFVMAWLFRKTFLRGERSMLLLELPPYRLPSLRTVLVRMWERAALFLGRAGTVILALSILLWAMATYPKPSDGNANASDALAQSFAGQMGHAIEPVIAPLGYDWKIGIGLIASFAAREVFVGTMAVVYNVEQSDDEDTKQLREAMRSESKADGSPLFTPLVCVGLMVFYVLAMQCISTVAIVRRETNSWHWPIFQIVYMTALAYFGALVVYQGGRLFGWQ